MEPEIEIENPIPETPPISTLKINNSDILFCVSGSFFKSCVEFLCFATSIYIIGKYLYPVSENKCTHTCTYRPFILFSNFLN